MQTSVRNVVLPSNALARVISTPSATVWEEIGRQNSRRGMASLISTEIREPPRAKDIRCAPLAHRTETAY